MYCELTTQYWAWKNVDAEYIGFCHYRRYFDFSETPHEENIYGEVMDDYIDVAAQCKYALDDASVRDVIKQFDVITTLWRIFARTWVKGLRFGRNTTRRIACL